MKKRTRALKRLAVLLVTLMCSVGCMAEATVSTVRRGAVVTIAEVVHRRSVGALGKRSRRREYQRKQCRQEGAGLRDFSLVSNTHGPVPEFGRVV